MFLTEQSWASLTKSSVLSLDLGKIRDGEEYDCYRFILDCTQDGGRRPPLLPSAFAAELETKSFTNGKDDKPLVKRLYEAAFEERFGKATVLDYRFLGWGAAEAAQLAEVFANDQYAEIVLEHVMNQCANMTEVRGPRRAGTRRLPPTPAVN